MPSKIVRRARLIAMGALALAGVALIPSTALAGDCSPAGVTVSSWAQFRTATTGITSCTAGNTYTVTISGDFAYSAAGGTTGLSWSNAGDLVIVGAVGAQRVIDMTGADTYFIRHMSNSALTVRNLVVKNLDGTAQSSSPVYVPNAVFTPTVTLDGTTIQDNNTSNAPVFGGGLTAMVAITNGSQVINNVSNGSNNDVVVANRRQGQGGGVYSATSLSISNSTVSGNAASGVGSNGGGGAWAQNGDVTVTNSTVAGNSASETGSTGGGVYSAGAMTVTGSTVSGNTITGNGGGVYANYNSVFTNTTIANNTATGLGGGAYTVGLVGPPQGGAVFNYSTVAGNTAASGPAVYANRNLTLAGSVVDNGTAPVPCVASAAWKASSYSVSTGSSCLQTSGTGDAVKNSVTEIKLGTLGANGGTTNTMLPQAGSVLIGWINAANPAPSVTTDQRGNARSQPFTAGAVQVNSADADLSALSANAGGALTLSPTFAAGTTAYTTQNVANSVTSATITPTVVSGHGATVTVNGVATTSGSASAAVALSVGSNAIPVVVTAQDGTTTKTYTVTIVRNSNDATLSGLVVTAGGNPVALTPTFASGTYSYTGSVANSATSATVTPTRNQADATITVNGTAVASGTASGAISLSLGTNTLTTVVTAQDGNTQTYTVVITRNSADATLSALVVTADGGPLTLTPTFASATYAYAATAASGVTSATVTPTRNQANATITVNGTAVASGTASAPISLAVGATDVSVVVTAQDGTTTQAYTVAITREPAPVPAAQGGVIPASTPADGPTDEAAGALRVLSARVAPKTDNIGVRLDVLVPGRVSIRGTVAPGALPSHQMARTRPVACSGSATLGTAGVRTVRCKITARAYRALATRSLSVTVVTTLTATDGSHTSATSHVKIAKRTATRIAVVG